MPNIYFELFVTPPNDSGRCLLIYGYAQGTHIDESEWRSAAVTADARLHVVRAALPVWKAVGLVASLAMGEDVAIELPNGVWIAEGHALQIRPAILRHPRLDAAEFDASYCDRLCEVTEYWLIDKSRVLASLRGDDHPSVEASARLDKAVRAIAAEVGRDFLTRASAALGNFEVFHVRPRLYSWRPFDSAGGTASAVSVEIVGDLASEFSELDVVVRLQNGHVTTLYTLSTWRRGDGPMLLRSDEPFSCVEVMIFAAGRLIDHGVDCRLTSVGFAGTLMSGRKTLNDPWSRRVANKAGKAGTSIAEESRHVNVVGHTMSTRISIVDSAEPWQPLSTKVSLLAEKEHGTLFLPNKSASEEVTRLQTIVRLFDSNDVDRAILVDPYFGTKAMSLLARVGHRCLVEVVTNIGTDETTAVRDLLARKTHLVTHPLKILSSRGSFHDRYLIVERGSEREVYVVSNSFAPVGPKDPIVVVRAMGKGKEQIAEYVDSLMCNADIIWPLSVSKIGEMSTGEGDGRIVASALGSPRDDPRSLVGTMGAAVWTKLASYLDTQPHVNEVCTVLQYLHAHTTPPPPDQTTFSASAADVLKSACQEMMNALPIPYVPRQQFHTPIEIWLGLLRFLIADECRCVEVSQLVAMMGSLTAKSEVEYGLGLGLELMCMLSPDVLGDLLTIRFREATASFHELADDQDPSTVPALLRGAVLLRQIYAFAWRPAAVEIFLGSPQPALKRLGLIGLFGHRFSSLSAKDKIAQASLAHVSDLEIAYALTVQHRGDENDNQRERFESLTRLLPQLPVNFLPDILTAMSPEVVAELARDLLDHPLRASRIHGWLHAEFEKRLEAAELSGMDVSAFQQWSPSLAARSAVARSKLEAFDALEHVVRFARKMGMRAHRHGRPREQALHYHEWTGTFVLVKVVTRYVLDVYLAEDRQKVPDNLRRVLAGFVSVLARDPQPVDCAELALLRRTLAQIEES